MIRFNIKNYDYVDSKISGEVQRFRINAPDEKSTFAAGKGKWGLLDWRGEELVGAIYDKINPFKEHLALTKKGKKYGYLDDKGRIAVDFIYESGTDFKNGVALVEKSGTSFYIDYLGEKIKKPKFKNEDENKAEIIPFRKDSPLWYKKISNSFDNKLSGSFASVSYFKENEEGNFVKFKTKAAADDKVGLPTEEKQKRTVVQLFLLCAIAFKDSVETIAEETEFNAASNAASKLESDRFNCAAIDAPNNIKTLNVNLKTIETLLGSNADLTKLLAEDLSGKLDSESPLLQIVSGVADLDPDSIANGMNLAKELRLLQPEYAHLKGLSDPIQIVNRLKTDFFWVIQAEVSKERMLMIIATKLDNINYEKISDIEWKDMPTNEQEVEELKRALVPDNSDATYRFFKIPDYLMIFKEPWKLPLPRPTSEDDSSDDDSSSNQSANQES